MENYFLNANLCDDFIFFVQIFVVVVFGFVDGDMDGDLGPTDPFLVILEHSAQHPFSCYF